MSFREAAVRALPQAKICFGFDKETLMGRSVSNREFPSEKLARSPRVRGFIIDTNGVRRREMCIMLETIKSFSESSALLFARLEDLPSGSAR